MLYHSHSYNSFVDRVTNLLPVFLFHCFEVNCTFVLLELDYPSLSHLGFWCATQIVQSMAANFCFYCVFLPPSLTLTLSMGMKTNLMIIFHFNNLRKLLFTVFCAFVSFSGQYLQLKKFQTSLTYACLNHLS